VIHHAVKEGTIQKKKVGAIAIKSFALLVVLGTAYQVMAQDATTPYPTMAPIELTPVLKTVIVCFRTPLPERNAASGESRRTPLWRRIDCSGARSGRRQG